MTVVQYCKRCRLIYPEDAKRCKKCVKKGWIFSLIGILFFVILPTNPEGTELESTCAGLGFLFLMVGFYYFCTSKTKTGYNNGDYVEYYD